MWIAGTPRDGMCYQKHTLPSSPKVLHVPYLYTHITPFRKDRLAILPSLAVFPSSDINFGFQCNSSLVKATCIDTYCDRLHEAARRRHI